MVPYYGDFPEDATVYIPFNTFSSDDPTASVTITNLVNTDIHIHKDGGTTQRNNAAGITMSVDYDSITGNHLVTIDTSDDTVGGFWVTGSEYQVRIEGTTVDGGTVNAWIGSFSIERSGGALALIKAGVTLANDAITSAKFDETTAFPVAAADSGATQIARVGADGDTLETLSDQLDTITTEIGAAGAGLTEAGGDGDHLSAVPWNPSWDTEVQSECTDALNAYAPPTKAEMDAGHGLLATEAKQDIIDGLIDGIVTKMPTNYVMGSSDQADHDGDITNIETEIQDIQSRLPVALVSGRMSSDSVAISGSTDAADKLEASAETMETGAAIAGTLSTTQMTTDLTEATDDHYNGRIIIWTSGVLIRQATDITDYDGATKMLTFTAITEAPSAADTFVIV